MNDASSMKWGITSTVDVVVDVDGRAGAEGSSSSTIVERNVSARGVKRAQT